MIKGYEHITYELTPDELKLLPTLIKGLENRVGKQNSVSSLEIQKAMGISRPRIRKMIGYIRTNDLIYGLCSTGSGYYVANNLTELEECMVSLKQRIFTQMKTLHRLEHQSAMFGGHGQITLFD